MRKMKSAQCRLFVLLLATMFVLSSCAVLDTQQKKGTAVGAGVGAGLGAVLGQVIGHNSTSTLVGAGIGAALGGLAGNQIGAYMDRQEQALQQVAMQSDQLSIRRSEDVLQATFRGQMMFATNSAVLMPGALAEVHRVAQVLVRYPETMIEVAGHTDASGDEFYNRRLSEERANAVANVLIQSGVNPARIRTVGYGESMPISSNYDMNRRVEVTIAPIAQ